jgi:hypothetical protein
MEILWAAGIQCRSRAPTRSPLAYTTVMTTLVASTKGLLDPEIGRLRYVTSSQGRNGSENERRLVH